MKFEEPEWLEKLLTDIHAAPAVSDALLIFQQAYNLDFVTYHLALTVADVVDTPYVQTTYGAAWVSRYLLCGYVKVDPILRDGLIRQIAFDWREVEIPSSAHDFLIDAEKHGIGANGYSIPIVDKKRRALFSVNSRRPGDEWSKIVNRFRQEWLDLGFVIHRKAVFELHGEHDPVPQLSNREIECLHWSALGMHSNEIAEILGLSEHTTQAYLTSARHKLGAATTTSATALAIQLRLINPYGNTPN
ncbi:LuxR family transcriptional regulator [Ochrobactrum sp. XJ1]|nr:LuxR family transcriptional regulator [Ochrobactrum sp. XJ1]